MYDNANFRKMQEAIRIRVVHRVKSAIQNQSHHAVNLLLFLIFTVLGTIKIGYKIVQVSTSDTSASLGQYNVHALCSVAPAPFICDTVTLIFVCILYHC